MSIGHVSAVESYSLATVLSKAFTTTFLLTMPVLSCNGMSLGHVSAASSNPLAAVLSRFLYCSLCFDNACVVMR